MLMLVLAYEHIKHTNRRICGYANSGFQKFNHHRIANYQLGNLCHLVDDYVVATATSYRLSINR